MISKTIWKSSLSKNKEKILGNKHKNRKPKTKCYETSPICLTCKIHIDPIISTSSKSVQVKLITKTKNCEPEFPFKENFKSFSRGAITLLHLI